MVMLIAGCVLLMSLQTMHCADAISGGDEREVVTASLFRCKKCPDAFTSSVCLRIHAKRDHPSPKEFECTDCQRLFAFKNSLKTHQQEYCPKRARQVTYICPTCEDKVSKSGLRSHQLRHAGVLYTCPHPGCNHLPFKDQSSLTYHYTVKHTTDTPYRCNAPGCQAAFQTSSQVARHKAACEKHRAAIINENAEPYARWIVAQALEADRRKRARDED